MNNERAATALGALALILLCLVTARVRGQIHCLGREMTAKRDLCLAAERRAAVEDARLAEVVALTSRTPVFARAE